MCPQFPDLMEKANGINTDEVAVSVAAGIQSALPTLGGRYAVAASFCFASWRIG